MPDEKKAVGTYVTHFGIVKKTALYEHILIMTDKTVIPIGQISEIEGELFKDMYEWPRKENNELKTKNFILTKDTA